MLANILAVMTFWDNCVAFAKMLQKTPEEKREAIVAQVQSNMAAAIESGRPV